MDPDGETYSENNKRQTSKNSLSKGFFFNASSVLQSIWVRCGSIFAYATNRRFMEGQLYNVLYCGVFFWTLFILNEVIK